jgi:hypothetical protein
MEKTAGQRKEKSRRHPTAAVHRRAASSGGGRVNVAMWRELFGDWIGSSRQTGSNPVETRNASSDGRPKKL